MSRFFASLATVLAMALQMLAAQQPPPPPAPTPAAKPATQTDAQPAPPPAPAAKTPTQPAAPPAPNPAPKPAVQPATPAAVKPAPAPAVPSGTPRPKPERFAKEIAAFAAKEPEKGGILFTGSSSIRLWNTLKKDFPGLPVLNRGFGGSVANDLIVHANTVVFRHRPKVVVVYTGSNDLNFKLTPKEVFADYTKFLNLVHEKLPKSRVIVTSVKISEKRIAQIPQVHELNRLLQAWLKDKKWARYVDCTSYLADSNGKPIREYYVADLLHLSPAGYSKWREVLDPVLREEWEKVK